MESNTVTFREAATLVRQGVQPEDVGNMPYIGLEHIEKGTLRLVGTGNAKDVTSTKFIFSEGDILFGKLRPYFRKVIHAPFDGVCSTDIWVVRANPGIDQGYLYYWMASQTFVNFATQGSEGTKMPRAKWDHVGRYQQTRLPTIDQQAIAHILGTLDDKIELNRKMNETLEAIAQALFKSWFIDFDPVKEKTESRKPFGMDEKTAALFPDSFVDSELGMIPEGWRSASIYEISDVIYGAPFASKRFNTNREGKPLIRIRNLKDESPGVWTDEFHPKGYTVRSGDIVVGMDGEFRAYLWGGVEAWLNQRVCVFAPKPGFSTAFVRNSIIAPLARVEATETATTVIHLGKNDIDRFNIITPDSLVGAAFSRVCQPLYNRIVANKQQSRTLTQIRDTLLPKLISGELRVPDAEKLAEEVL